MSEASANGEHRYTWSVRSTALIAALGLAMSTVLALVLGQVSPATVVVVVVVPIVVTRQMRVALSPIAVSMGRKRMAWPAMELAAGRWGTELRTIRGTASPTQRFGVILEWYDRDWRSGPIGDDLRRWAPHLLD